MNYINPADLHTVWPQVKIGVECVLRKTKEKFLPEDVYAAIKSGSAQLFMVQDGFTVLQNLRDQFTNEPVLHIWIAYHSNHVDLSQEFHINLQQIAHNIGAKQITFTSPRRWEKRSGAQLVSFNYVLGVKP